jgi:hypothetical protein
MSVCDSVSVSRFPELDTKLLGRRDNLLPSQETIMAAART